MHDANLLNVRRPFNTDTCSCVHVTTRAHCIPQCVRRSRVVDERDLNDLSDGGSCDESPTSIAPASSPDASPVNGPTADPDAAVGPFVLSMSTESARLVSARPLLAHAIASKPVSVTSIQPIPALAKKSADRQCNDDTAETIVAVGRSLSEETC